MNFFSNFKPSPQTILSILIGISVFFLITGGGKILNPTYVDWLYEGDSTTHWLGWQFFRYSPLLQWPLGSNLTYGMDIGSSIVFSDSATIMAFIFKPINAILPNTFQYSGLWILICFLLQSYFAWKLLSLFTKNKYLPLLGSIFFTIAPTFLWRLQYHYALFAHWVILASFYLYFRYRFSAAQWSSLLSITALIEPYLLAMLLPIFLADLAQKILQKQLSIKGMALNLIAVSLILAIIMWAAGYFMLGDSVGASGFGYLRANLLTFFDPDDLWSLMIQNRSGGDGDYEGFGFLGLGILILGIIAVCEYCIHGKIRFDRKNAPIILVILAFFVFAISNNIGLAGYQIFSFDVPSIFKKITLTYRTSGRFIWPVYYLVYLAIFYVLFTRLNQYKVSILCIAMLTLQIIDSQNAWRVLHNKFAHAPAWTSPLKNPAWDIFAVKYEKIIWINLPRNSKVKWFPLCEFAATHRLAINHGYFGRYDPKNIEAAAAKMELTIKTNELDQKALYIFEDDELWKIALKQLRAQDIVATIDGYKILAPGLRNCNGCDYKIINNIPAASPN